MITDVASAGEKQLLMTPTKPIVFVVDDDISVRESLTGLVQCAGWQVETSHQLKNSLPVHPFMHPAVCCSTLVCLNSTAPTCRSAFAIDRLDMPIIFIRNGPGRWRMASSVTSANPSTGTI